MTTAANSRPDRILIIGRSPTVILETAGILRGKGFHADATNQFDDVLTDYDAAAVDVVVFGGMVPPHTKQHLREEIAKVNDRVTFVQGLAGIPGLIAAQVEGVTSTTGAGEVVGYDAPARTLRLTLRKPVRVVAEAWWATSLTPPEPKSTSMRLLDALLDPGQHAVTLPAEVPGVASFLTASVGPAVHAFTVGAMPAAVTRLVPTGDPDRPSALPPVRPVTTHST
ncbi:hypothetical protein GCM10010168_76000 [Actinoplanes ianthinogenes]|uniref:Uncharacterized protein n=1 Tax=Actinoplanes ianthinogenes TaxID=122358 RepID=A0ABM7MA42_9ACTN|nr:hypothetical protein [Actinoplanes ianthinogenes]BCJ48474.1 hypothetical protein Aiant_91310 [Actinoplanes ianthinogenes]GGR46095.1 hypothetical protein GCM10010168_76000 [Actinoplanes ianthinogenes]